MMIKQELVKKIKDYFNLNIYETKVWLALLSKTIASAGEIADLSGVPRSRTYDVLESLEKQGFAIPKVGKPSKYIAVKPSVVLEKMKKNAMFNAEEKIQILNKLGETKEYEELLSLHNSSTAEIKREEISGSIKGDSNISSHLRETIGNAKSEVLICVNAEELLLKSRLYKGLFEKLKENNIKIKTAINGTDEQVAEIQKKYEIKAQKIKINSKFIIVDREQVFFSLNKDVEEELAVWINSDFFANSLASLFDTAIKN